MIILFLISSILFLTALFKGFTSKKGYRISIYKKIIGIIFIIVSILNFMWDYLCAKYIYDLGDPIDIEELAADLNNLKKIPSLQNLSYREYQLWRKNNEKYLSKYSLPDEEEVLYRTQFFYNKYGREKAKQLSHEARYQIMSDSVKNWNNRYINIIFREYIYPYSQTINGDTIINKNKIEIWNEYSTKSSQIKLDILRNIIASTEIYDKRPIKDIFVSEICRALRIFFILFAWGFFIIKSKFILYKNWKDCFRIISYILLTLFFYETSSSNITISIISLILEIGIFILCIFFNSSKMRIRTYNANWKRHILR